MTEINRWVLDTLRANMIPDPRKRRATLQRMAAERRADRARFNALAAEASYELRKAQLTLADAHLALAIKHEQEVRQSDAEPPA